MNKNLKIILIVLGIILIGFLILEYKDYRQQKNLEFLINMSQKCREVGEKIYQKHMKVIGEGLMYKPEYYYSEKLRTCLYVGGYNLGGTDVNYTEKTVKDGFTGEELLVYALSTKDGKKEAQDCAICVPSDSEFEKEKNHLIK